MLRLKLTLRSSVFRGRKSISRGSWMDQIFNWGQKRVLGQFNL